ncbi:hypothetical protein P691DRAFT_767731 [Macrolepiota fuliginosa MF-IS2]|uniref:Uncharacterized protein n=1 Tax=Macrolepiota fuliginosa MF-IS2 TaxID=1400762 RepID=A0A9P6BV84_9AGAR|nr:hypothetical protein P691DRAFT_767731 [Macrolepiota fuliginosa MF-IS2]
MVLSATMLLLMIIAVISTRKQITILPTIPNPQLPTLQSGTRSDLLKVIFRDGVIYYIYTFGASRQLLFLLSLDVISAS